MISCANTGCDMSVKYAGQYCAYCRDYACRADRKDYSNGTKANKKKRIVVTQKNGFSFYVRDPNDLDFKPPNRRELEKWNG